MLSVNDWFVEKSDSEGIVFGFKINKKLHAEKTPYQQIDIYETTSFGNLMAIDGFVQLTARDNFIYHEMLSHPALFTHKNPENIVIIGGGDCGTLYEVLKHDTVKKVYQIEIDKKVTDLSLEYFPELCISNNDPRAELLFEDGIEWIKNAKPNSLDVIIVDSTDPIGPAEGLFSENFYKSCLTALKPGGIIVQQSESPILHRDSIILPMHKAMQNAGFFNVKTYNFPQPCYPSGWWSATIVQKSGNLSDFREEDVNHRGFKTNYYNLDIHQSLFVQPEFMHRELISHSIENNVAGSK